MKRAAIVVAMLTMCPWSFGKSTNNPAAQRPPKVNSQEEFNAYKTAAALTDAAALEKASDDFAAKYPESELRPLLYRSTMQRYQMVNNADKMLEMARKV